MVMSSTGKIAKLLFWPLLAGTLSAASSTAVARPVPPAPPLPAPIHVVGAATSAKEQAMSSTERIERWAPYIREASLRFHISEAWIKAVMRKESGGRTLWDNKPITSDAGAMGIMQVMPDTYEDMRAQHGLGADPYDPHDNVLAGAAYLSWLYGKYGYPALFAAYNAGPEALEAQQAGVRTLPAETRDYIKGIGHLLGGKSDLLPAIKSPIVMLTRPDGTSVSIDAGTVNSIRAAMADEYAPGVKTVVSMGHVHQGVRENLAAVSALLKRHGGKATVATEQMAT